MRLQLSTWQEVEHYLQSSTTIIIPIGSTEQHGPNGLIGTDTICPEVVANGVGEKRGTLVAPSINVGMAQHHMRFPGSITLRPTTLIAVIIDTIQSLSQHGFEHLYFLNGHGGNIATMRTAFSEYFANRSLASHNEQEAAHLHARNWWDGQRIYEYRKTHFDGVEGSHATPTEVSLTYYFHPRKIEHAPMTPEVAPRGSFRDADDYRQKFPDGRIGSNPALASKEHGERIFNAAVSDVIDHMDSLSI